MNFFSSAIFISLFPDSLKAAEHIEGGGGRGLSKREELLAAAVACAESPGRLLPLQFPPVSYYSYTVITRLKTPLYNDAYF